MIHPRYRINRRLIILMIVVGMVAGCASVFQDFDDRVSRKRFKSDYEALDTALAAYDAGEYEKALVKFKSLSVDSASDTVTRRAWLGEICCRLMIAESEAAYTSAIGMWHAFGEATVDADSRWTISLLDPLIVRKVPPPAMPHQQILVPVPVDLPSAATKAPVVVKPPVPKPDDHQLQAELAAMKKKVKQADQLQQQLDQVVEENRSLKEKIKALEAIDQSIQKKKTEISTPSE